MTLVIDRQRPADPDAVPRQRVPRAGVIEAATVAVGVGAAMLVVSDGSWGWQLLRVLAVIGLTDLAVTAEIRLGPRGRGRLAAAIGTLAVAVGVGFVPHVLKSGFTATSAAGLVVLAAGVVLLVAGTATATRGRGLARGFGATVLVLLTTTVVTLTVAPAIAATNVPPKAVGAIPASVGLDVEAVTLIAADGVELAAWYVPSQNGAAVVLRHGAGSTRSNVLPEAAVLAEHGFGVLLVDARGHGASGGRAMDFGWYGDIDIAAATGYLADRPDVDDDRIGVVGSSMGGEEAIGAAAGNDLVRAVVAEGGTARTAADKTWLSDVFGIRGAVQEQLERLQYGLTDLLTEASPPPSLRDAAAAADHTRFLLITAGTMPDEGHAAAHIAGGAPDRVETWTVAGAGHTAGLETAPEEWERRVTAFLTNALLGSRGS
jgi:pimeloyl-ACP methyl ester carboxylesterase